MYRTTNLITKEFYIGVHSTYNLEDKYLGSGTKLWRRIQEYGRENFEKEILEFFETPEDKFNREKELVNEQMLQDPLCMNLVKGGIHAYKPGFFSKEHQLKCSSSGGKACSERLQKDKKLHKQFADNFGKIGREKLSKVRCDWTGRTHNESAKEKIGKANSLKQSGEKNSQYGTCWIYKEKENLKIRKDSLEKFLKKGWKKGRILK